MKIRDKNAEEEASINLMPLLDMVFLLLIFFLVAATVTQEERDLTLHLPSLARPQALSDKPRQLIVNIRANGSLVVNEKILTRDELAATLKAYVTDSKESNVLVRADEESLHKYFAGVMALCHQVGVNQPRVAFLPPEEN